MFFEDDEKILIFDEIAECFYNRNFGQLSKTDMELLMFHFYIEKLIKDNSIDDGVIDYKKCSDYLISQELGITQQRVRNLKIKNQLRFPHPFDWKKSLAGIMNNARYDERSGKVQMYIPDPNLFLEIQNFLEESGAFIETQLNKNMLQIRAEYFIDLSLSLEDDGSRKKIIKALKQEFEKSNKNNLAFDEKNIGRSLITAAVDLSSIVTTIAPYFSKTNFIALALSKILLNF